MVSAAGIAEGLKSLQVSTAACWPGRCFATSAAADAAANAVAVDPTLLSVVLLLPTRMPRCPAKHTLLPSFRHPGAQAGGTPPRLLIIDDGWQAAFALCTLCWI